ncbi:hypothetical protein YC2023_033706 [Brassica napus]
MAGRKKRGQKNQSNQQEGTTTRARKNIAHVVKEHVEEFSDGNSSDDLAHREGGDKAASAEFIKEMISRGFAGDASTSGIVTTMLHDGRLEKIFLDMHF